MRVFGSILLLAGLVCFQFSCNNAETQGNSAKDENISSDEDNPVPNQTFTIDPEALVRDFTTWYNYTYYNVPLSQDFIGLDVDSVKIDKVTFLNKLQTGNVLAFKTKIIRGQPVYQLFTLHTNDESIKTTIRQMASQELAHSRMEGIEIPEFNFTDLSGKVYNKSLTKGKIIVLKCWFIHCVACVREFPELNQLVDAHKARNDVLFISLALDSKKDLIKFLQTKEFRYATVPNMEKYMVDQLNIAEYPTHLLIGRNGKIIKVVNKIEELEPFLKHEINKNVL